MGHEIPFWQEGLPAPWDEGRTLAKLLAALDAGPADAMLGGLAGDLVLGGAPSASAAATARRLIAVFNEQVARVTRLMDGSLCALYLAKPASNEPPAATRRRTGSVTRPLGYPGRVLLWLRALAGAPWSEEVTRRGLPAPLDGPAMQTLLDQRPLLSEVADVPALNEWAAQHRIHRWLYVPLFGASPLWPDQQGSGDLFPRQSQQRGDWAEARKVALGVLAVGRHEEAPLFTAADTRLLGVLGEELVLAIENARLSEQVHLAHELARHYDDLLRNEAERERVLEELGEGVMVLAPTGQILRLNAVGRDLLGWPGMAGSFGDLGRLQDYESLQMRNVFDEPLLIEEWPMFRALRGEEFQHVEVRYLGPHGVERFLIFSGRLVRDTQGTGRQALLSFHEATSEQMARAQLEQMVRLADQRSQYVGSVLEAMTDSVLVCNSAGTLLLVNPAGKRLLSREQRLLPQHYTLERLLQEFHVRTLGGQAMTMLEFPLARALRGETVRDVELLLSQPGGGNDWQAAMSAAPIRDRAQDARILGAVAVLVDVTRARTLDRAKDEFLALAAHELKTPITSIRGFAQLLQRGARQAPEGRERRGDMQWVEKIMSQTERLTRLVEELTDAARADLGRFELKLRPVALGALLRRVVEAQQVTTEKHTIQVQMPPAPLILRADEHRLEQVFSNLVVNAIKYSPNGGEITLTVQEAGIVAGTTSASSAAGARLPTPVMLEVVVRDQGQGIARADLERVFDRFTRADIAKHSKTQGLGLGLYISRAIIEAHGGTITAESEGQGKGSAFIVRLPLQASSASPGTSSVRQSPPGD
jgi:signal transduction histidine kinase